MASRGRVIYGTAVASFQLAGQDVPEAPTAFSSPPPEPASGLSSPPTLQPLRIFQVSPRTAIAHGRVRTDISLTGFALSGFSPSWEPSWEPFAVDCCGLLWTAVESKAFVSGLCGRLWTAVDTACRSTDQKDGACRKATGSSSPVQQETPAIVGVSLLAASCPGP